jgi:hypothetical protein
MMEIDTRTEQNTTNIIEKGLDRDDDENWVQLRLEGRQPERRAYHTSFAHENTLYIFGGHDIREGQMNTMWSLDLSAVGNLVDQNSNTQLNMEW